MRAALRNKPFVWLCAVYLTVNLSFAFIKILMAYYIEYQLLMKAQTTLVMGLMLVCVTISLPFWQWLSRKMDKGPAYALGMAVGALAVLVTFFLPHGATPLIYVVSVLAGFGFAANWIFPWAMVADVGDYDRLQTGQQRSGMYYGVWGLATKISEALALAAVGWILTGFGYVANAAQTPQALLGIRLFFGLVPAIFIFIALPFLFKYPITRRSHGEVRPSWKPWMQPSAEATNRCRPSNWRRIHMNPIRVAIVGCGRISDLHQLGYRGRQDARIVAVCDTNKAHAKKKAKEWGVEKIYTDYSAGAGRQRSRCGRTAYPASPALSDDRPGCPGRQACLGAEADGALCRRSRPDDRGGG